MTPDLEAISDGALQTLVGLGVSTVFLLTLFIGFLVIFGLTKFRRTGRHTLVVRNLVDRMDGGRLKYLSPDDPSGQVDQLRTPELLERADPKS